MPPRQARPRLGFIAQRSGEAGNEFVEFVSGCSDAKGGGDRDGVGSSSACLVSCLRLTSRTALAGLRAAINAFGERSCPSLRPSGTGRTVAVSGGMDSAL